MIFKSILTSSKSTSILTDRTVRKCRRSTMFSPSLESIPRSIAGSNACFIVTVDF